MSDKASRRFEKLKKRYESARRRAPEKGVVAVADILASGPTALMSPAGREAIDAELKAMKAERRALRKLQILAGEAKPEAATDAAKAPAPDEAAAPAAKPKRAAAKTPARKAATPRKASATARRPAAKRAAPKRQAPGA